MSEQPPSPYGPPTAGQPSPQQGSPEGGQPYGQPYGAQPHPGQQYAAPNTQQSTLPYIIVGFVCAAVALLFLPPVFGAVAIVLGVLAHKKGDQRGRFVIGAGIAGLVIGMVLSALVFSKAREAGALAAADALQVIAGL